jgi:hypothetical protein
MALHAAEHSLHVMEIEVLPKKLGLELVEWGVNPSQLYLRQSAFVAHSKIVRIVTGRSNRHIFLVVVQREENFQEKQTVEWLHGDKDRL